MPETKTYLFNRCDPLLLAGQEVSIQVDQDLRDDGVNLLQTTTPDTVHLRIDGPRFQLTPDDIAGVYPAPGSEESPDEYLPHIALNRRTLPWERLGPYVGSVQRPWLALLLVKESELKTPQERMSSPGPTLEHIQVQDIEARDPLAYEQLTDPNILDLSDDTDVHAIFVPNSTMVDICPRATEIRRLCHMKRVVTDGVSKDTAIVISNRLPDVGQEGSEPEPHTALLVSMERREDLYSPTRFSDSEGETALIVLHHWTFTPSKGGDFEQVMKAIRIRPNGGVLRFGNLPQPAQGPSPLSGGFGALLDDHGYPLDPLQHTLEGNAVYRGPLRPFPAPPRSQGFAIRSAPEEFANAEPDTPLDYSHAAAFELGRLLALADSGILDDLRETRSVVDPIEIEVPELQNNLPEVLQKPDWVSNPGWYVEPWTWKDDQGLTKSLIKEETVLVDIVGEADPTGIEVQLPEEIQIETIETLGQVGTPSLPQVGQIDIGNATSVSLGKQFANVLNAGLS